MALCIRPLTPALWPDLEDLFGRAGASNGCWCQYWRLGPAYGKRPREQNRAAFRAVTEAGPPGLLAYEGARAVGWCQVTPRADLPWLERQRRIASLPVDDRTIWSVSCFYVRRGYRRRGIGTELLSAAIAMARQANAAVLEAYPVDPDVPGSSGNIFTGVASTFRRAGFTTVGQRSVSRPILRLDLGGAREGEPMAPGEPPR